MRHLLASLVLVSAILVTFTGCDERQNMRVVPNRDGHAWVDPDKKPNIGVGAVAGIGEIYHTVQAGDTITNVSKKYGMKPEEFIKRNELKDSPMLKPGSQVIVNAKPTAK